MPPWFFQFFGEPPPRAERGEVRFLILDALKDQPRHGYDVIQTIEKRSGGAYRPSPGTVYPTLQMLEEMGHVRSKEEEGGRKVYELTDAGREELEARSDDIEDAYERFGGGEPWDGVAELGQLLHWMQRLMRKLGRSMRRGRLTTKKRREIERIIRDAADRIEDVLRSDR